MQAPLDLSDQERAWIAAHPTIRVGAYPLQRYMQARDDRVDGYLDYSAYHLLKARSPGFDFVLVDDTRATLEAVAAGRAEVAVDILPSLRNPPCPASTRPRSSTGWTKRPRSGAAWCGPSSANTTPRQAPSAPPWTPRTGRERATCCIACAGPRERSGRRR